MSGKVWLIGAGTMAVEYAKVLQAQGVPLEVIGRGEASAQKFYEKTQISARQGGLTAWLASAPPLPLAAIVSVGVEHLATTTLELLRAGIPRLLVEKPLGMASGEIQAVCEAAETSGAEVYIAYNRRCYASTLKAQEIIAQDGGVTSLLFEFTEWSHVLKNMQKGPGVKEHWFFANSTHVVDLAFHLGGIPREMTSYVAGKLDWHPRARFSGAGVTEREALFAYHANWQAPGRWKVEIMTERHRLYFAPMEQLQIQEMGSLKVEPVTLEDELDQRFKPGVFRQVAWFLNGESGQEGLCSLAEHRRAWDWYERILNPLKAEQPKAIGTAFHI